MSHTSNPFSIDSLLSGDHSRCPRTPSVSTSSHTYISELSSETASVEARNDDNHDSIHYNQHNGVQHQPGLEMSDSAAASCMSPPSHQNNRMFNKRNNANDATTASTTTTATHHATIHRTSSSSTVTQELFPKLVPLALKTDQSQQQGHHARLHENMEGGPPSSTLWPGSRNDALLGSNNNSSGDSNKNTRPTISYVMLISQAVQSEGGRAKTLKEIYQWIENNYSYYREV